MLTRFLFHATDRVHLRSGAGERDWDQIAAARADLKTLSRETLRTFHAVLRSLVAELR